ncbi:MAG: type I methionyl aminopeptidase [Oscillospiraceae bacterium]|jgi:methionyl aminopeptidase|nr:type I methionyl aminopeptidase [Oscillospiraceae bacterium]
MITLRNAAEIEKLRIAGRITADARKLAGSLIRPGITTAEIDREVHDFIVRSGAIPTFLGYSGFPNSACISVNDEVIHGIPSKKRLQSGDIVSVDVGATAHGFVGDCAATFAVGEISDDAKRLITVTRQCFFEALNAARSGNRVSDISRAVQQYAEAAGYSVVREYIGHGVGENMHEDPEVPNFIAVPRRGPDPRLAAGMVIAIEPMVNAGTAKIRILPDGWTVLTADGALSAHYENTVLITRGDAEILTRDSNGEVS